jgi:hypothetical protein
MHEYGLAEGVLATVRQRADSLESITYEPVPAHGAG